MTAAPHAGATTRTATPAFRQSVRDLLRLAALFRDEWGTLARAGSLSVVAALFGLAVPLTVAAIFHRAYPAGNVSLLGLLLVALVVAKATRPRSSSSTPSPGSPPAFGCSTSDDSLSSTTCVPPFF